MTGHTPAGPGAGPSPLQRRLWFLEQLGTGATGYVTTGAVRLRGRLDRPALAAAVAELPRRHPGLRTRCVDRDGVPVPVTDPAPGVLAEVRLPAEEVAGEGGVEQACAREALAMARTLTGRAFAAALLTVAEHDHVLLLVLHQSAGGAADLAERIAEIGAHYAGAVPPAPEETVPDRLVPDERWLELLRSTDAAESPEDRRRPPVWQPDAAVAGFPVPDTFPAGPHTAAAFLTVVHTLLARHSGRWEGVLGLRTEGRTVPLPLRLPAHLPFEEAVRRTAGTLAEAGGADAEALAEQSTGGTDLSRNPLLGVLVEVVDETPVAFGPLAADPFTVGIETTRYDLVARLRHRPDGGFTGELVYATALFGREAADRIAAQLARLCAAAAGDRGLRIGRMELLPPAERRAVLPAPHGTATPVPEASVAELISAQAARTPGARAVECGGRAVTYAELMKLAKALAGHLRGLGAGPGDLVAIVLPRGVELVATLIGVHLADAAYLPLDPEHPADRLRYVLGDAGARFLVTTATLRESLPATTATIVAIDELPATPAGAPRQAVPGDLGDLDAPAYVIYTSGSTGRPKGVLVTHRALTNFLWSMRERPGLVPGAAFPAITTVSFDIAALELFLPLITGGWVSIGDRTEARDPERLAAMLDRVGARVLQATPVTWRLLLDSGWTPPAGFTALCGGEKLPAELADRLCARGVRLWDLYGPTETTVWSSVARLENGTVRDFTAVANTTLYVLDDRLEPVPLGGRGELYIGGRGLAAGYLGRPGLTADRFVPDPHGTSGGGRLYRTGDVARRHADGRIEILGRTDHQLKIRGFRVEPGEIESALVTHPGVRAAVVHAVAGQGGDLRLVAYILPAEAASPPPSGKLYLHCARLVPPYMIPAQFAVVETFPTTPNGKLDRAVLPAPVAAPATAPVRRAPRTPAEQVVAKILAEVLDRTVLDATEDFFAIGGNSLLATRAISRLRAEFDVDLPVSALFEARTVEGVAVRLATAESQVAPVTAVPRTGPLPLSFAQRRMWFLHQLDPGSTAYAEPLAVRLPGPVDPDRLTGALSWLFERHEILRTRYVTDGSGDPVQVIDPPAPIRLEVTEGEPRAVLAEELARPFDLAAAPPVRCRLVRAPDGTHFVLFVLHHIATDDRSHEVLAAELRAIYREEVLPPLPVQYADYAVWQRERSAGARVERQRAFWRERLAGLEPTELRPDRPLPPVSDTRAGTVRFTVPAPVAAGLAEVGRGHDATAFITLLAGFLAVLRRYTARTDLSVGVPVTGRNRRELENLIGHFVNMIVVRAECTGETTFGELLAVVRAEAVAGYAHADVPFELVVEDLAPDRDPARNPLFGIVFVLHGREQAEFEPPEAAGAKFDLGCHLTERPDGGFDGRIEYPVARFEETTVRGFAEHYVRLLRAVAANPDSRVDRIPLRTGAVDAAPVSRSRPAAPVVPDLIAARAAAESGTDAIAVTGPGRTLTYAELDREVNRLAHRLRELGARRGEFVVVRLPRTTDLVVALLAVLKTGAAYIPLDPEHPVRRLEQALADSSAPLVIAPAGSLPELPAGTRLVALDDPAEQARIQARPPTGTGVGLAADDLAYAVYTSGSTGRPKAAMVTHGGLANYTAWAVAELDPEAGAGSPVHTSLAYDLALTALYPVLAAGATVELVDTTDAGIEPLARALRGARTAGPYSLVKLTPTHLGLLSGALPAESLAGTTRCLVVGGEELRGEQLAGWSAHAPGTTVVNSYGPSETAVACCVHIVPAGEVAPGPVPIGRAIPGASVHLLDAAMRAVPDGVAGEIYIGGHGVGPGYLARGRLTADRFVPDPFAAEPGARLFRTGDLARRGPDGALVFLARGDQQVKIRGFRVEPGEVESVLAEHAAVRAAAVVVDRSDPGNARLAAHVAADQGAVTVAGLRAHLAERLPAYLVPALWGLHPELPLLGNGKIDRRALPALTPGEPETYAAPATPAEEAIAGIWASLLGVDRVGRHDRFFDLGGESLLATKVVARLRERLGVPVSVRDVFAAQTVAALAEVAAHRALAKVSTMFGAAAELAHPEGADAAAADGGDAPPPITPVPRSRPLPLSFAQQRLWLLDQLVPGSTDYLVVTAFRLRGRLDIGALTRAVTGVVARHEVLRTRYRAEPDGDPIQVVDDPPARIELAAEHASPDAVLDEELATPIDLATGPVLRARLVVAGPGEHVLVLAVHHIAVDAVSMDRLVAELAAGYRGEEPQYPPVQYGDFAAWQRERLSGAVLVDLLGYWRARLAGLEPTELPADRPRPATRDARGAALRFSVPPPLASRLDRLGRQAGATGFMTYLAGFLALLARYTGRADVAVGVPVAGRGGTQVENLVGFFANTVVLRADLGGEPSFTELLGRVSDTAGEAYLHDELPFERLVEELAPRRDLSRNPLFQVLFAFREDDGRRFRLPGLEITPEPVPTRTAKFDFTLELARGADGGLTGEIEYATALFDRQTVDRLARHYLRLLGAAADRPETPIGRLDVLDAAERNALIEGSRGAVRPRPALGLAELVAEQAARTPDAVAVDGAAGALSYAELEIRANRLARHLLAAGIGRDDVVGVCSARRPDLVVALLAVHRAGAAYLPLDPDHPADRLAWMLADSGARLVLVDAEPSPAAGHGVAVLSLAADAAAIARLEGGDAPVTTDPDAIAYVSYTSGSTGRPKGVAVPHRGIRNRVLWAVEHHGLGPRDRLLQKTAVTFDASVWEFFGPLVSGGTVVLAPDGAERDPAALVDELVRRRITVLQGVPSFYRVLAEEPGLSRCRSLRLVLSAGEPLPVELAARLCARLSAVLVNTYGPTECSIDVTSWTFHADGARTGVVPIGLPLDNTRVVVHTPDGRLAPVGVPGELALGGEGLARGYLGRPRLTADRFVPDPFGPPGARAYRTGDVVRRRRDGVLEFLGRTDDQVKIRGVRVELGEVEAVLSGHPALAAVAVVARPGPEGAPRLVGYLVPRAERPPHQEIRAYLLARLPEPYVPSVLITLDELPTTSSGKVDRAALPEPDGTRDGAELVPARNADEKLVADIVAGVLGLDAVGVTDDFFDLGGHSLLAVRVAGRLRAAFGMPVSVRAVFEDRTVAALAARLTERAVEQGDGGAREVIPAARRDGPAPLSFSQQRLWLLDRLQPGGAQYQVGWALRLGGPLDTGALAGALADLLARHDILRTRYVTEADGTPVQVVDPVVRRIPLPVIERPEAGEARLAELIRALVDTPFDLSAGAPVTAHLIRLGAEDHVFLLVMHHIVCDVWSEEIMARELAEYYRARVDGGTAVLRPRPLQYADYAIWQRAHLTGEVLRRELAYWRERLAGMQPLELPADRPRPAVRDGRGATVEAHLPAAVAQPLVAVGRRRGATPFMVFLAVFAATLRRYTGSGDLAIGTVVADRGRPELENVVGPLLNTVVVRVDVTDDPSALTLIDRVRESVLDGVGHDELPFDRLVEELAPQRDLSRSPLVDLTFGLRDTRPEVPRLAGLDVRRLPTGYTAAKFDVTMLLTAEAGGGYGVELEYAAALFTEGTMRRLAGHFRTLAGSMARAPEARLTRLPMLDVSERHRALVEWNPPQSRPRGEGETLTEAFAARVASTPDATAVVGGGERLTYAELADRASALARRLHAAGVRPESPVAVVLDRSPAGVVVFLAVLEAGGVFVPLDPAHPAERLALMLDDLAPAAVVTETGLLGELGPLPAPVIAVDAADAAGEAPPADLPRGDPGRLAYMVYTSGSTGRPKAVMISHQAFAHHCRVVIELFGLGENDRCLFFAPLTFDPAMEQIAAPLLAGATVVVSEPGVVPPAELFDRIAEQGVTMVAIAPAYFREVVAGVRRHDPRAASLRLMIVAGDVVTHDDARRWLETGLDARLISLYGQTETTIFGTTHEVTAPEVAAAAPETALPIGRPIPGTRAYVLDEALEPVGVGVPGEVCFGGVRVGRGYRGQPRQTADRFVPDPFAERPGDRLYRTGDRARYRADGVMEFLGRVDTQVKIRGFRVELGEIEAALAGHPSVRAAAVAAQDLPGGDRRLVGYVVPGQQAPPPDRELRGYLRDRLPEHMVPAVFVPLAELPRFASQKVNRKALPPPEPGGDPAGEAVAPRDEVEEAIAGAWAEVLGLDTVGVEHEFFDLGGHSLLATRLMTRLQDLFGIEIPLRVLFEATTVSAQAAALERLAEAQADQEAARARSSQRSERSDDEP
ncbi:non-ribosomal peptide synthetase [Amycolatopsis sp. YIM 10]|uniref:non-ribosomal peptide synthetase n=1 Tax=Amycolatopsis sp. YIM 10 TaxID=2653857 RepID=UPI0012900218|nr:non-ribosomal peptide synthetase [Amycolatopsis sp. YIM 10]QFU89755.1 Tyrocidine synthase 3 [Amycolatopsis sp. YIM 10]